jgi:hypothetical protein
MVIYDYKEGWQVLSFNPLSSLKLLTVIYFPSRTMMIYFCNVFMVLQLKILSYFIYCWGVLCPHIVEAQASFTANISPGSIGKNETAELRLNDQQCPAGRPGNSTSLKRFYNS